LPEGLPRILSGIRREKMIKKIFKVVNMLIFLAIIAVIGFIAFSAVTNANEKNNFSIKGYSVYTVLSPSMVPTFDVGSLIFVKKVPEADLKEGDIISFYPAQGNATVLTHRIKRIEVIDGVNNYFTQGDANNIEDNNPVIYENILGTTVYWIPKVGGYLLKLKTPMGIAMIIGVTIVLLIISHVLETSKKKKLAALAKKKKKASGNSSSKRSSSDKPLSGSGAPRKKPSVKTGAGQVGSKRRTDGTKKASSTKKPDASRKPTAKKTDGAARPKSSGTKPKSSSSASSAKSKSSSKAPVKVGAKPVAKKASSDKPRAKSANSSLRKMTAKQAIA
jgi:signal peptidase